MRTWRGVDQLSPYNVVGEHLGRHGQRGHQAVRVLEGGVVEQAGHLEELVPQLLPLPLRQVLDAHDIIDIMELDGALEGLDLVHVQLPFFEPLPHLWHKILTTAHHQEMITIGVRLVWQYGMASV